MSCYAQRIRRNQLRRGTLSARHDRQMGDEYAQGATDPGMPEEEGKRTGK